MFGMHIKYRIHMEFMQLTFMYRRESNLAIFVSPVKNNNVQFQLAYCYRVKKIDKFLAVRWV
jgi:hypothetical protein